MGSIDLLPASDNPGDGLVFEVVDSGGSPAGGGSHASFPGSFTSQAASHAEYTGSHASYPGSRGANPPPSMYYRAPYYNSPAPHKNYAGSHLDPSGSSSHGSQQSSYTGNHPLGPQTTPNLPPYPAASQHNLADDNSYGAYNDPTGHSSHGSQQGSHDLPYGAQPYTYPSYIGPRAHSQPRSAYTSGHPENTISLNDPPLSDREVNSDMGSHRGRNPSSRYSPYPPSGQAKAKAKGKAKARGNDDEGKGDDNEGGEDGEDSGKVKKNLGTNTEGHWRSKEPKADWGSLIDILKALVTVYLFKYGYPTYTSKIQDDIIDGDHFAKIYGPHLLESTKEVFAKAYPRSPQTFPGNVPKISLSSQANDLILGFTYDKIHRFIQQLTPNIRKNHFDLVDRIVTRPDSIPLSGYGLCDTEPPSDVLKIPHRPTSEYNLQKLETLRTGRWYRDGGGDTKKLYGNPVFKFAVGRIFAANPDVLVYRKHLPDSIRWDKGTLPVHIGPYSEHLVSFRFYICSYHIDLLYQVLFSFYLRQYGYRIPSLLARDGVGGTCFTTKNSDADKLNADEVSEAMRSIYRDELLLDEEESFNKIASLVMIV